jgi:parallel beta-helix repeat protein
VTGCLIGEGILADFSSITITTNQLHDIDRTGILVEAGVGTVEFNNVQNANFYGVGLYQANKSVVSSNTVAGLNLNPGANDAAIQVYFSNNSIVSKNTVLASPSNFVFGVWLLSSSGSSVTGNVVSDFAYGIVMQNAGSSVVQSNKLSQLLGDGIFDGSSLGGNNVTKNTVNEAAFGIFTDGTTSGDVLVPNTFFNTTTTIDPNPSQVGSPQDL